MKKVLVLFSLLALVVNMGLFADDLSDGKLFTRKAKEIFGDLSPSDMEKIYSTIGEAADKLGKISTALDSYKYLKSFQEVVRWSKIYKDASTDDQKRAAGKAASKSMLKMLDAFASLAGGPLYGMILPKLLEAVDKVVDVMHLKNAEIKYAEWASYPWMYLDGKKYHYNGQYWNWADVAASGYHGIAVEVIAKYNGPLTELAATVQIIDRLEKIKEITGQR